MTSHTPSDLVGTAEVCRMLNVHPATVSRLVGSEALTPAHKLPGRNGAYLFKRSDIEKLAAERAEASA